VCRPKCQQCPARTRCTASHGGAAARLGSTETAGARDKKTHSRGKGTRLKLESHAVFRRVAGVKLASGIGDNLAGMRGVARPLPQPALSDSQPVQCTPIVHQVDSREKRQGDNKNVNALHNQDPRRASLPNLASQRVACAGT